MLKSRLHDIPNGFQFYQPETGWEAPKWQPFETLVSVIIEHRKANPRFNLSTDRAKVAEELDAFNSARLREMPGGSHYLLEGASDPPNFNTVRRPRQSPDQVVAGARKVMAGIGTIIAWLGDGLKPVDLETATQRAEICIGCDRNVPSEGIARALNTVGDVLHSIAQAKSEMKLQTQFDDRLETCKACGCVLNTKVWTPIEHVKRGLTNAVVEQLWEKCWIRKEANLAPTQSSLSQSVPETAVREVSGYP